MLVWQNEQLMDLKEKKKIISLLVNAKTYTAGLCEKSSVAFIKERVV